VLFTFCYFTLRAVLRIAPDRDAREREAEILVLRHQLAVLKRTSPRPKLRRRDRIVIVALAGLVPKGAGLRSSSRRRRFSAGIVSS